MLLSMRKQIKYIAVFCLTFFAAGVSSAYAAGEPSPSLFSNPIAVLLLSLMAVLLIVIGVLANVLLGAAQFKVKKNKDQPTTEKVKTIATVIILLLVGNSLFAQDADAGAAAKSATSIAGMSSWVFYILMSVIFLELLVILVLLVNVKMLLKVEKEKTVEEASAQVVKKPTISWWSRLNSFKPVEQEADIDLGHDYDGIRELDNRLPPWWLYGFYVTILVAVVYLWRFHVSHEGPSSIEEYNRSVSDANAEIKEYLAKKGEAVDENTVTISKSADDLAAGKEIFVKSCAACHKETGAGDVGPNLTDDYWLHGGDIKSVFKTIRYGINAMPQWQNSYSNKQIAQVASYVKSLHGTNPPNPKAPQGELSKEEAIPAKTSDSTATKGMDSAAVKENKTAMK
ncbi:MAG: c-type cytochrome [Bacteroidetes bacterium]|nr:c-type cytochrome [Bacteroidota bacterium]